MLEIEACEESRKQARAVVALLDVLRAILQSALADQKIVAAARQIQRMNAGDPADG